MQQFQHLKYDYLMLSSMGNPIHKNLRIQNLGSPISEQAGHPLRSVPRTSEQRRFPSHAHSPQIAVIPRSLLSFSRRFKPFSGFTGAFSRLKRGYLGVLGYKGAIKVSDLTFTGTLFDLCSESANLPPCGESFLYII